MLTIQQIYATDETKNTRMWPISLFHFTKSTDWKLKTKAIQNDFSTVGFDIVASINKSLNKNDSSI